MLESVERSKPYEGMTARQDVNRHIGAIYQQNAEQDVERGTDGIRLLRLSDIMSAGFIKWRELMADTTHATRPESTWLFTQRETDTWRIDFRTEELVFSWRKLIKFATSWRDVVAVIEQVGMDSVADRISYLYGLANDDPNEVPIQLESLQRFALFIMGRQHLPRPRIGVNPDGIAQAVWRISEGGVLAMNFLPAGDIRFAVILRSSESKSIQRSISGVLPPDRVMYTILPYVDDLRR